MEAPEIAVAQHLLNCAEIAVGRARDMPEKQMHISEADVASLWAFWYTSRLHASVLAARSNDYYKSAHKELPELIRSGSPWCLKLDRSLYRVGRERSTLACPPERMTLCACFLVAGAHPRGSYQQERGDTFLFLGCLCPDFYIWPGGVRNRHKLWSCKGPPACRGKKAAMAPEFYPEVLSQISNACHVHSCALFPNP